MLKYNFSSKKDIKKLFKSIFQGLVLVIVAYVIITALTTFQEYKPYKTETFGDQGFITISYFGVDRSGSDTLISTKRLEKHLKALKDAGYVTITQQDVLDYYNGKKLLPPKSLLLIFEDGRRDTAIFAQKIMEELNFKATILTYADKFEKRDTKFLMPEELLDLEKSTYWELGTNGYRLEYINVFDRYDNYIGELDSIEYGRLSSYLDRNYNHYLMDYIRDQNDIPKESYKEMKKRIEYDYSTMQEIYNQELGYVPAMYILMHSNTGQFGTNNKTSQINEKNIYQIFSMNFNREGYSFNTKEHSIYDLTRMQPQSYWSTNHLLMRVWDDTRQEVKFVSGDEKKAKKWEILDGVAEFKENSIILTSMPEGRGILRLKDIDDIKDVQASVQLLGNKLGSQGVYLRADEDLENYIYIQIKNNFLYVKEKSKGIESVLYSLDLDELDKVDYQSIEENKMEAEIVALETEIIYSDSVQLDQAKKELQEKNQKRVESVDEGAEPYIPVIELKEPGNRQMDISIIDNKIDILIDGKEAVDNLTTINDSKGSIYLETSWGEYAYSQRNLVDDVYDGVFKGLVVKKPLEEQVIYEDRLHGIDAFVYSIISIWETIVNWFIKTL